MDKTDRYVFITGLVSLVFVFLYKFVLVDINELFLGAFQIGEILYNIVLSVIASVIFYIVVVYLEKRRQIRIVKPIIESKTKSLNLGCFFILKGICDFKGLPLFAEMPSQSELRNLCEGISLRGRCPMIFNNPPYNPENWFDFFGFYFNSEKLNIEVLHKHMPYLNPELLTILDEISLNNLHRAIHLYMQEPEYDDMSNLSGPLWNHLNLLRLVGNDSVILGNKIILN
ncbi:hypothetical protein [Rufibacter psychrotolerans]|uniref:hypothetical protein n=1 Tax=Rufibacter psychrotolerans TaxID=2812556 RepID=UPI0019671042|nr:hypothetical protein [Rufibacter sp. SYSU D00308]